MMAVYPFAERWVTGDNSEHHVLDRPRNAPTRTAFGVAGMTGYGLFWIAGGNDLVATQFQVSLNSVTYFMRVAVFVGPVLAFIVTKRICIALQRADHERLLHGAETAISPNISPIRPSPGIATFHDQVVLARCVSQFGMIRIAPSTKPMYQSGCEPAVTWAGLYGPKFQTCLLYTSPSPRD